MALYSTAIVMGIGRLTLAKNNIRTSGFEFSKCQEFRGNCRAKIRLARFGYY